MNKYLFFTSFLLQLLFIQQTYATDLMQVIELAQKQDSAYQSAFHKANSDKETYTQARSRFMPTVSYQYSDITTDQEVYDSGNFLSPKGSDSFGSVDQGITINQPVFDLEIWNRFQKSKNTVNRAEAEFNQAQQELYLRTSEAYFLVLEREDQLDTIRDEKSALLEHFEMAKHKRKAGLGRSVDVDSAEARYLESVAKEIELESRLDDSVYALAEIIGSVKRDLMRLTENITYQMPKPSHVQTWVDRANASNPAIKAKEEALLEATYEVDARKNKHYPTLNLTYTNGKVDTEESIFSERSNVDSERIVLRLDVPIFQGFYVSSQVKQGYSDRYRAQEDLRGLQRENERQVRDAFRRINASINQVKALTRSAEAQERMLHLKTKGYNAGRYSLIEVLDAQKDFSNQKQARTKARYDYVLNIIRLKAAAGILTEQDITRINTWLTVSQASSI